MKEQLKNDLKHALRNKERVQRDTLRLLLTSIKNAEIAKGSDISENEFNALLQKQAKQRRDSIAAFQKAGRSDLVEAEQAELAVIKKYLPRQMGEDEIRGEVRAEIERQGAKSMRDIGKVMGPLMGKLRGKVDGKVVQRLVRAELNS
jgi:uncharacterized protein YqeY